MVAILHIRVGHGVRVIGVEVIAALRALKHCAGGNMWSLTGSKRTNLRTQGEREFGFQARAARPSLSENHMGNKI